MGRIAEPVHPMFKRLAEGLWESLSRECVTPKDASSKELGVTMIALMLSTSAELWTMEKESAGILRSWDKPQS
jgi:hypothetical protein